MEYSAAMRAWLVLAIALVVFGCAPPKLAAKPDSECAGDRGAACEAKLSALAAAFEAPSDELAKSASLLVAALDAAHGASDLAALHAAFAKARGAVPIVRVGGVSCVSCDDLVRGSASSGTLRFVAVSASPTLAVGLQNPYGVLAGIARLAGVDEFIIVESSGISQLFANDPLASQMAGATPRIELDANALEQAATLSATLRRAYVAAGDGRAVEAAGEAGALQERLATSLVENEATARARAGLTLLVRAGLTWVQAESAVPAAQRASVAPQVSGAYGALAWLKTAGEERAEWFAALRPKLAREVSEPRLRALDRQWAATPPCDAETPPLFREPADLGLLDDLAGALAQPDAKAGTVVPGKLPRDAWLSRYDAAVSLVLAGRLGWLTLPQLLLERGVDGGADLAASATWRRVSKLGRDHLDALRALAYARPEAFSLLPLASLAAMPGTARDPAFRDALVHLMTDAVRARIRVTRNPSDLFEAGVATLALTMAAPGFVQGPQLAALAEALGAKLSGEFAREQGWTSAALHVAHAALSWLLGDKAALAPVAHNLATALGGAELAYPMLGQLLIVGVTYADLALQGKLELELANPKLMSSGRSAARGALARAIADLAKGGPTSPPERDLALELGDFGDAAIAAAIAAFREPAPSQTCAKDERPRGPAVRSALDRATKKRNHVLTLPAMRDGNGAWVRRARVLVLLGSDVLDTLDSIKPDRPFAVPHADAERLTAQGLDGWVEGPVGDLASITYRVARTFAAGRAKVDAVRLGTDVVRGIGALRKLFAVEGTRSLFGFLDDALGSGVLKRELAVSALSDGSLTGVVLALARRAYAEHAPDQGDVLLLSLLLVTGATDGAALVPRSALALAREYDRPIVLALALRDPEVNAGRDPAALAEAVARATKGVCHPADSRGVLDVEDALGQVKRGDRSGAVTRLVSVLDRAEASGLVVPRQSVRYRESAGRWEFNIEMGSSLAHDFLNGASTFNLGFGTGSTSNKPAGTVSSSFVANDSTASGREEAARHYAHVALLTSILARLDGQPRLASSTAHRAVATWLTGVRLGHEAIVPSSDSAAWSRDAASAIAIAAQQAVDAEEPFLAGSLWGLLPRALGAAATDEDVAALTRELPPTLAGVADLDAVAKRAKTAAETLFAPLSCTKNPGAPASFSRVTCERYPLALSLRIGEGLSALPRLGPVRPGEGPVCEAWRALDAFLGAADERRYDPDAFTRAVGLLRRAGKFGDAAVLLANQRHPQHCSPELVDHARSLSREDALGLYLRADMASVAVTCAKVAAGFSSSSRAYIEDLAMLDELTARHTLPLRNFELLVFAADLARSGDPGALYAMTHRGDFLDRWRRMSPDMGALALLAQSAAEALTGRTEDALASLPTYTILCTTHASPELQQPCSVIAMLRSSDRETARTRGPAALDRFIELARQVLEPHKTPRATQP